MWIDGMSAHLTCSKSQMPVQLQGASDEPTKSGVAECRFIESTVGQAAKHGQCMV